MSKPNQAKKDNDHKGFKATALGLTGVGVASMAPKNILGYETVYHGVPHDDIIKSIKKNGLLKRYAGSSSGAADVRAGHATPDQLKGRVFTTKNKAYAHNYTHAHSFMRDPDRIAEMKVPYRHKGRLHVDHVMAGLASGKIHMEGTDLDVAKKLLEGTNVYKHSIPTRFIKGSDNYKGISQFAHLGNMKRYLSQPGGKARMAKGVAQLVGAGALAYAAKKIASKKS